MVIARVDLEAPADRLDELAHFYGAVLGLPVERDGDALTACAGDGELGFAPATGAARPFYHFALLVPGDRFAEAQRWIGGRAHLLSGRDGNTVFDFSFWDALACYVHDPAGNIVELIAHRGLDERGASGPFAAAELAGISEIGIVTPRPADAVATLARETGLELWSGGVEATGGLGFVGRKVHTLIVAGQGRGWLPTGRSAQPHPVAITLIGETERATQLPATPARVRIAPAV
jgi:catechol 2,3-dioxygenase-like lactoylglutathione lyase family enzyme